uniref:Uncharacterized protein n=1 Tax=Anopheles dirus TaxID=7168 RepID=A0A182NKR3_9DIPT
MSLQLAKQLRTVPLLRWAILFAVLAGETVADPTVGDQYTNPYTREDDDTLLCVKDMGCLGSKDRLSKEDMDFLKSHTRYDESTIKEWYKGFKPANSAQPNESGFKTQTRRLILTPVLASD